MQTLQLLAALAGIVLVVVLLIKKIETRTVLLGVGLLLGLIALKPMAGIEAFSANMVKSGLIKAICASMGFAFVMKYTKCDQHLVRLLTKPLKNVGFVLIPLVTTLTYFINIAIPSASGCAAAVGATLIPLLISSGVRAEMAGAAVFAGTFGAVLSPGSAHNIFVTDLVKKSTPDFSVQDIILVQMPSAFTALGVVLVCLCVMAFIFKDYQKANQASQNSAQQSQERANILYALMPLVPLIILVIGGTELKNHPYFSWSKMGVAEAMIVGAIVTIFITRTNPQKITKEFFSGMGSAYAEIIGIIIAAGVFVAGLSACGAIDAVIAWLKTEQSYVKFGGTFIPFLMGLVTGSGDAAAFAFNQAVTIHASQLGFSEAELGMAAAIAGALGRSASPIAGACIVCAGIAMVNPFGIAKRTILGMFCSVVVIAFFIL